MAINIRKQIGNTIGAAGARSGKSLEETIEQQAKRGGLADRDREWIAEGYRAECAKSDQMAAAIL